MKKICLLLAIIIVLFSGCDSSVYNWKFDYDIEQMANKIRRMIYEDATYRNVNTINLIR